MRTMIIRILSRSPAMLRQPLLLLLLLSFTWPAMPATATGDPENLVRWRPGLTSSAQPDRDYLSRAKALGYEVVINLAPPEYNTAIETEGAILAKQGVVYVQIPVNWSHPAEEDFRLFSEVMRAAARKNVLVHCQINLRGSSFTFLHRVLNEGASPEEARDKMLGVWMPNPTWRKFIDTMLARAGKKVEID